MKKNVFLNLKKELEDLERKIDLKQTNRLLTDEETKIVKESLQRIRKALGIQESS